MKKERIWLTAKKMVILLLNKEESVHQSVQQTHRLITRMKSPLHFFLLDNALVIPVFSGLLFFNRFQKKEKLFFCYLLFGLLIELFKSQISSPVILKATSYFFLAAGLPLLMSALLIYSQKKPQISFFYTFCFITTLIEFIFFEKDVQMVSFSKTIIFSLIVYQSINAFVIVLNRFSDKQNTFSALLIVIPILVLFVYHLLLNAMMLFLYNPQRPEPFISFYVILKYLSLIAYLMFAFAFYIKPPKERYLD